VADHIAVPVVGGIGVGRADVAWAPLREPLFRSLWIAAVISYTGTWMQNVGAGWLMTQLTTSPLMVSLVQAAAAVPVFLVVLPAGALADMVDRRRPSFVHAGMDGRGVGCIGHFDLAACGEPLDAVDVYAALGARCRDERSGVAGDNARGGLAANGMHRLWR